MKKNCSSCGPQTVIGNDRCARCGGLVEPESAGLKVGDRVVDLLIAKLHALRDSDNPPPRAKKKRHERCTACSALGEQCGPCRRDRLRPEAMSPNTKATLAPKPQRYLDLRDGSTWWDDCHVGEEWHLKPTPNSDQAKAIRADEALRYLVPIATAPTVADCVVGSCWTTNAKGGAREARLSRWTAVSIEGRDKHDSADSWLHEGACIDRYGASAYYDSSSIATSFHLVLCPRAELLAKLEVVEKERQQKKGGDAHEPEAVPRDPIRVTPPAADCTSARLVVRNAKESGVERERAGLTIRNVGEKTIVRGELVVAVASNNEIAELKKQRDQLQARVAELEGPKLTIQREGVFHCVVDGDVSFEMRFARDAQGNRIWTEHQESAVAKLPLMPRGILIRCDNGADD